MKSLMYKIIFNLTLIVIVQNNFIAVERVYGEDRTSKSTPPAKPDPFLRTESKSNHISESDILFTIDESDIKSTPEKKSKSEVAQELIDEYLKKGKKYEARNILSDQYFKETDNKKKSEIKKKLDELNKVLVFSRTPSPDAIFYKVKAGDSLVKIAKKFNINYAFIMRINNKPRTLIKIGERLKILKGELSLLVDKSDYTLTILLNGHYIKQYPVGIGKSNKTPVGEFIVDNKLINPTWYAPDGVYPYGHPKNVLGTRWIGFEDRNDLYGYGIHGTADPDSIGKDMSNGCIRMRNENVEELFDFVKPKTRVVMQE
ncbi:MAG: L,D-transpeptidase family protein, partial [Candidatus Brocadiales bacterium]|nr:L,D-transpeptidase family protein [Candidatus Brocadiales bacterium]